MKDHTFSEGGDKSENILTTYKNLPLQNHWANFNQTWHNLFIGERDSSYSNERQPPTTFFKGENQSKFYRNCLYNYC